MLLFYRDGACPVCKAALRAYQRRVPTFRAAGARVIALSPESRDAALITAQSNDLDFEFLSDVDGAVARRFGVTYDVVHDAHDDVSETQPPASGERAEDQELPVPASYVIDAARRIVAAPGDGGPLLEPDRVVAALRGLARPT